MRVRVKPSWNRGSPLSDRELERTPTVYGELTIGWWIWDPAIHRLVARVTDPAPRGSAELLPPLADVSLVSVTNRHMILRGVETLKTARGKVEVVQEWIIGARLD